MAGKKVFATKGFIPGKKNAGKPGQGNTPWTDAADDAADAQAGIAEGSPKDLALDSKRGVPEDDTAPSTAAAPAFNPARNKYSKRSPQRG